MRKTLLTMTLVIAATGCGGTTAKTSTTTTAATKKADSSDNLVLDQDFLIDTGFVNTTQEYPVALGYHESNDLHVYISGANCRAAVTALYAIGKETGIAYPFSYNGSDWVNSQRIVFNKVGFNFDQASVTGYVEVATCNIQVYDEDNGPLDE